jgi:hypothetical protein
MAGTYIKKLMQYNINMQYQKIKQIVYKPACICIGTLKTTRNLQNYKATVPFKLI